MIEEGKWYKSNDTRYYIYFIDGDQTLVAAWNNDECENLGIRSVKAFMSYMEPKETSYWINTEETDLNCIKGIFEGLVM